MTIRTFPVRNTTDDKTSGCMVVNRSYFRRVGSKQRDLRRRWQRNSRNLGTRTGQTYGHLVRAIRPITHGLGDITHLLILCSAERGYSTPGEEEDWVRRLNTFFGVTWQFECDIIHRYQDIIVFSISKLVTPFC